MSLNEMMPSTRLLPASTIISRLTPRTADTRYVVKEYQIIIKTLDQSGSSIANYSSLSGKSAPSSIREMGKMF